jgi:hypothetical protein
VPVTLAERRVAIGHVRVAGATGDPLRLRLGVDRLLGAVEVRPGRLPPSAILVVRSLADPLPRGLDPRAVTPAPRWERAAAVALDDWAVRAARPAAGAVAADAGAVVFADRAELLATVVADWCRGSLAGRWWWRVLGLASPPAVLQALRANPEAVPAAVARLARARMATAFAARVPPAEAAALVRLVAAVHGAWGAAETALAVPAEAAAPQPLVASPAPWAGLAAELDDGPLLAVEQETLVGLALALRHAAGAVRAPAFSAAARAWRVTGAARAGRGVWRDDDARGSRSAAGLAGLAGPTGPAVAGAADRPRAGPRGAWVRPPGPRAPAAAAYDAPPRDGSSQVDPRVVPGAPGDGSPRPRPPRRSRRAQAVASRTAPPALVCSLAAGSPPPLAADGDARDHAGELLAAATDTRLGGLLHLVLVGQLLGFYGDFTTPARPGIRLDVWDFVTLVGRGLLRRPPRDRIWPLLAELGRRRPHEPAGRGFRPPRAWRVPRTRLDPFPDAGTWRYAVRGGRLLLTHPAGFAVLDAKGADVDRELRRYRVTRARPVDWPDAELAPLGRWAAHATSYVRARLAAALGVSAGRAAPLALRRPARVLVTDTRIDVMSSLADLPIEVRLAGLDRDPGFVPAAGRSLCFHFA